MKKAKRRELKEQAKAVAPVAAGKKRLKVSTTLLANARTKTGKADAPQSVDPFVLPFPAPGVLPTGTQPSMAMDDAISSANQWAMGSGYPYEGTYFLGYPYLAQLAQRPEYRKMSEIIAKEMTRKWVKLIYTADGEDKGEDKLRALEGAMREFRVQSLFREASEHDGFFGRAQIYIDVGQTTLDNPLVVGPKTIRKGMLKTLKVIEPVWTYPAEYNSLDPLAADFYKPTQWYVMGKRVHASRLITLISREVPDLLKPAYAFGGLSLTQMAKPYVDNWLRARQSVSDLLHSFSVMILATNMGAELAGDVGEAGNGLLDRIDFFNQTRDNRGTMAIDKDTEVLSNVSTPLTTLDKLLAQAQEQQASVAGIPLIKLFGITPSGLNASSEGEIATFDDWISASQEQLFRHPLTTVLNILQLHLFGAIDPDITFRFEPMRQMSELDKATIRKSDADAAVSYMTAGVLMPDEERTRLATSEESIYPALDLNVIPELPDDTNPDEQDDGPAEPGAE